MIIHTKTTNNKRQQNTPKRQVDAKSWDALMKKYGITNPPKAPQSTYKPKEVYRREVPHIPSLDTRSGVAAAVEGQEYSGTEMIGIGQLHKSNAIPVFKQEVAADLAKMRR